MHCCSSVPRTVCLLFKLVTNSNSVLPFVAASRCPLAPRLAALSLLSRCISLRFRCAFVALSLHRAFAALATCTTRSPFCDAAQRRMPRRPTNFPAAIQRQIAEAIDELFVSACHPRDYITKDEVYNKVFEKCGMASRAWAPTARRKHEKLVLCILRGKGLVPEGPVRDSKWIGGTKHAVFRLRYVGDESFPSPTPSEELHNAFERGGQDALDRLLEARRDEMREAQRNKRPRRGW